MSKFRNFFKKPAPQVQQGTPQSKVETAIVLCLHENGGNTVGYLNVAGIEMQRPATVKDMYRMVCEVKAHLESVQISERLIGTLNFKLDNPAPTLTPPAPTPPITPTTTEGYSGADKGTQQAEESKQ